MPSYAGPPVASRPGEVASTLRLLGYLALTIALVVMDHRGGWLSQLRSQLNVVTQPLWWVAGLPGRVTTRVQDDAATRAGVLVLNAPGANRYSAGEHTIALLLAITRQIPRANETTHTSQWERKKLKPVDLRGRTVGIVGLGRVGGVVAKRLAAFEMKILAYDPYIAESRFAEHDAESVSYDELLRRSDIITYHVPSTPETRNMLCAATFPLLKEGVIVLNCSRGDVVDERVLAEALKKPNE